MDTWTISPRVVGDVVFGEKTQKTDTQIFEMRKRCRRYYILTIFFGLDRPSPGSLSQFDTVTLLNQLLEPAIANRLTIPACSLNEMTILFGNLISEQFAICMVPNFENP